ncbi:hypothetical protein BKI52_40700 [marine bacterium AO1-C]|nr:hypothetical protein BKI52_40700 [marine bacterium AO1-C]
MNLIKIVFIGFFSLLLPLKAFTQTPSFEDEMAFIQHLFKQSQYQNVLLLGQQLKSKFSQSNQQSRLALEMGFAHHYLKKLDSAAYYFAQVSPGFAQYDKARFYQSLDLAKLTQYQAATQALVKLPEAQLSPLKTELYHFQLAGLALLQKDYQKFTEKAQSFSYQYAQFASQEKKLLVMHKKLKKIPRRSAFVAGLFSAIIPGTGKMYAGKPKQGLNLMLQNLFMGAQAVEALLIDGVRSPRFIIFGGLFSIFYIGNIWGSALSVKLQQREAYETIHQEILFNLDVPLRLVFR